MNQSIGQWRKAEAIFHQTVDLAEPQRTAVLGDLCAGDTTLMAELSALLQACEAEQAHSISASGGEEVIPSQRVGPYRLDRLLGRGGMGAVYLAQRDDGQFLQQVAIKIVDMPLATGLFRERFRAERQILAGLVHPYIARLLDGGVGDAGELYIAMEYVEGVSITHFCSAHELAIPARIELFRKVCEAVQFAHQNLVVHRDLKPDNILVAAGGSPRLLDFGTAKLLIPAPDDQRLDLTRQGMQAFTPRYASPEQVMGRPVTIASDIYSLGVLLFVLLTDQHPYELADFSIEQMMRVVCEQPPRRPGSVDPRMDTDLDSIVLKALRKEPSERYITVDQLSSDLQAYLENRPVQARRGNVRYIAGKFLRRNRFALAAASLLLIALLGAAIGIAWQARIANLERRKAAARSADLRALSNSLLSELDDAIKLLPGSTPAQKLIVTRMLQYLDRLSRDGADDETTQLDLAEAYRRVGNLQGNPYDQNIGDPLGGLSSIEKATAITGRLKALHPNDDEVLHAYATTEGSRGEVLLGLSRLRQAVEAQRHACDTSADLAERPGATSLAASEAATACGALGDGLGLPGRVSLGDQDGARAAYRRALAMQTDALRLDPISERAARGIPVILTKLGNLEIANDPAEAARAYRTAIQSIDSLAAAQQTQPLLYTRASILRRLGVALTDMQDPAAGFALLENARAYFAARAAADPADNHAKVDLNIVLENEAFCYENLADPALNPRNPHRTQDRARAESILQQSVALDDLALKQNPHDLAGQASLAAQRVRLGMLQQGTTRGAEGMRTAARGLAELRGLTGASDASSFVLDQAAASLLLVKATPLRDPPTLLSLAQRNAKLHPANIAYQLTLARAYGANGNPLQARSVAQEALSKLPPTRSGEPKSSLRASLEQETKE